MGLPRYTKDRSGDNFLLHRWPGGCRKRNLKASALSLTLNKGWIRETGSTAIEPYYTLNQLVSGKAVLGDALITYYAPSSRLAGPLKGNYGAN